MYDNWEEADNQIVNSVAQQLGEPTKDSYYDTTRQPDSFPIPMGGETVRLRGAINERSEFWVGARSFEISGSRIRNHCSPCCRRGDLDKVQVS